MNIRNFFASLVSVAFCIASASAQTPYKQLLSTNFGLPSPQPEETLPKSSVPVQMPERVAKVDAQTVLRPVADNVWEITSGWEMCEGDKVMTDDWYNATVPGTVLRTLVNQGAPTNNKKLCRSRGFLYIEVIPKRNYLLEF